MRYKVVTLLFCLVFLFSGCSKSESIYQREARSLQEAAQKDVQALNEVTVEDITECVDYIRIHIYRFMDDWDATKRLIYYSTYLKELGSRTDLGKLHIITNLAMEVDSLVAPWFRQEVKLKKDTYLQEHPFIEEYLKQINEASIIQFTSIVF